MTPTAPEEGGHVTPRERFRAAMRHERPVGRVPFMELEFQIHEEYVGESLVTGAAFERLSRAEKERALHHNAEVMVGVAEKAGHDAIMSLNGYWEISPGEPAPLWIRDEDDRVNQLGILRETASDRFFIIGILSTTVGIPDGAMIEKFVSELFESPETVTSRNRAHLEEGLRLQERYIAAGADGICNACDVAFNSGLFMSPGMMDEFFFPYFHRWTESLADSGIASIWHTDGDISAIIETVAESGLDAIQCIDPVAGMDMAGTLSRVEGRLSLIGNVNCALLQSGPAEEIDAEVKRLVTGCRNMKGFVLSGCNAIFKGIAAENYDVMVRAHRKYGGTRLDGTDCDDAGGLTRAEG